MEKEKDIGKPEEAERRDTVNEGPAGAAVHDGDKTRVYDFVNRETRVVSGHKWISDEDEQVIKPVGGRSTQIVDRDRIGRTEAGSRSTQIADRDRSARNTRIVDRSAGYPTDPNLRSRSAAEKEGLIAGVRAAASAASDAARSVRNVQIADKRRFSRFLKIVGVLALMLALEIGYFRFTAYVGSIPGRTEKAQKELELTQKENRILSSEIKALGDHDSTEELRQSWVRLKEQVEKAAAETSY